MAEAQVVEKGLRSRVALDAGVASASVRATRQPRGRTQHEATQRYDAMTGPESVRTGYFRALFPIPTRALTGVTFSSPATL